MNYNRNGLREKIKRGQSNSKNPIWLGKRTIKK